MNLKQLIWTSLLALTLAACGGGGGSPAAPPVGGIKFLNGDNQVTISWNNTSGIYYWIWVEQANNLGLNINQPGLGANVPGGGSPNIFSDYVMSHVVNGYWYSYAVNAHAGNPTGPGGPQSNVVVATPRWAGAAWQACSSSISKGNYPTYSISGSPPVPGYNCPSQYASSNLNAVTFGTNNTASTNYPGWPIRWFLAVGDAGAMYASSVGVLGSNIPANLSSSSTMGSAVVTSSKIGQGNWFNLTGSNTSACGTGSLRGVAYGWGTFVAVGDSGAICFNGTTAQNTTANGAVLLTNVDDPTTTNWYNPDSYYPTYGGTQALKGSSSYSTYSSTLSTINFQAIATNASGWNSGGGSFVAVGTQGTILNSGDGKNWSNTALLPQASASSGVTVSGTSNTLNALSYNFCGYTSIGNSWNGGVGGWYWIAVGANGTMMFSGDSAGGQYWNSTPAPSGTMTMPSNSSNLRGIACSGNATPGYGSVGLSDTIPVWVVVGDDGAGHGMLWTSYDGLKWITPSAFSYAGISYPGFTINGSPATNFPETSMTSVTYGTRFVATGASGKVYVSTDGATWYSSASSSGGSCSIPNNPSCIGTAANPFACTSGSTALNSGNTALDTTTQCTWSGVGVALNAVAHVPGSLVPAGNYGYVPFGYIAVGAGGAVTFSQ